MSITCVIVTLCTSSDISLVITVKLCLSPVSLSHFVHHLISPWSSLLNFVYHLCHCHTLSNIWCHLWYRHNCQILWITLCHCIIIVTKKETKLWKHCIFQRYTKALFVIRFWHVFSLQNVAPKEIRCRHVSLCSWFPVIMHITPICTIWSLEMNDCNWFRVIMHNYYLYF